MKPVSARLTPEIMEYIEEESIVTGKPFSTVMKELLTFAIRLDKSAKANGLLSRETMYQHVVKNISDIPMHEKQNLTATFESLDILRDLAEKLLERNRNSDEAVQISREASRRAKAVLEKTP